MSAPPAERGVFLPRQREPSTLKTSRGHVRTHRHNRLAPEEARQQTHRTTRARRRGRAAAADAVTAAALEIVSVMVWSTPMAAHPGYSGVTVASSSPRMCDRGILASPVSETVKIMPRGVVPEVDRLVEVLEALVDVAAMAAGISPPPIPAATPGSVSTPSSATPACKVRWGAGPVGGGSALAVPAFPAVPLGPADDSHAGVLVHVPSSDESFGEGKVNIAVELEALQNGIAARRAAKTTLRRKATKARAMLASDKRRRSLESGLSAVMAENQAEDSVKEKAGCPAVAVTPGRAQSWTTDIFRPACLLRSPVRPRWSDCRPSTPGRRPGADPAGIQPRRGAPPS